jgi:phage pi2 protein 07
MCNSCSICLENLCDNNKVIFQCSHEIHLKCYIECIKNNILFCPLCRQKIKENVSLFNYINTKMNNLYKSYISMLEFISNTLNE